MDIINFSRYKFYEDGRVYCRSWGEFLNGSKTAKTHQIYYHLRSDLTGKTIKFKKSKIINYYKK